MELVKTIKISASGMQALGNRLRVISENLANSQSLSDAPGGEPYRRKTVMFGNEFDRVLGAHLTRVKGVVTDSSEFGRKYDPNHPAADDDGYVLTPNVNTLIEMMDMREAQRSYQANLKVIQSAKEMIGRAMELLRA